MENGFEMGLIVTTVLALAWILGSDLLRICEIIGQSACWLASRCWGLLYRLLGGPVMHAPHAIVVHAPKRPERPRAADVKKTGPATKPEKTTGRQTVAGTTKTSSRRLRADQACTVKSGDFSREFPAIFASVNADRVDPRDRRTGQIPRPSVATTKRTACNAATPMSQKDYREYIAFTS